MYAPVARGRMVKSKKYGDDKARKSMKSRYKKALIEAEFITEKGSGFIVINSEAAMAIRLLME